MTLPAAATGLTIATAARQFRAGELSPVELVSAMLKQIEATEPWLHAYVVVDAEGAIETARRATADFIAGRDLGPLHGIPIAIKDIFDVRGIPTRCGSAACDDALPAESDSASVARLRAAGAIILGKTVTQEFAAGVVSPPARNPWDIRRSPGGSSGGSAASVAVGSALGAMGSDTGGSIRIPASVTGIVGLKPTYDLLSTEGVMPLSWALDTVGPLARTVEDTALMFNALVPAGHDSPDATRSLDHGLHNLRIGIPRPYFFDRLQDDVRRRVEDAYTIFADAGAKIIDTPWLDAEAARAVAFLINRVETAAVHERMVRDEPERLDRLNPELQLRLKAGQLIPSTVYIRALHAREQVRDSMARLFTEHQLDAVAVPTLPGTAVDAEWRVIPFPDGDESVSSGFTRLTMPFNATGQPALSIPCGNDRLGLPVGLQIVGRPFTEPMICQIGHAYLQRTGWDQLRPSPFEGDPPTAG